MVGHALLRRIVLAHGAGRQQGGGVGPRQIEDDGGACSVPAYFRGAAEALQEMQALAQGQPRRQVQVAQGEALLQLDR